MASRSESSSRSLVVGGSSVEEDGVGEGEGMGREGFGEGDEFD